MLVHVFNFDLYEIEFMIAKKGQGKKLVWKDEQMLDFFCI